VPWRFPIMSSYAKLAVATVVVISVGLVGLAVLRPGTGTNVGGPASQSPLPSESPSAAASTSSAALPALTQAFRSDIHGISISGPAGWNTRKATETWTAGVPYFASLFADVVYDESTPDVKFIGLASQALGDKSPDEWVSDIWNDSAWEAECGPLTKPTTVDGASGVLVTYCPGGILTAVVATADRGYLVILYGVGDKTWFDEILATVQLHPEDALDEAPSAAPSGG
jgi:hypothetical protein